MSGGSFGDKKIPATWMTYVMIGFLVVLVLGWTASFLERPDRGYTATAQKMPNEKHMWYVRLYPGLTSASFVTPYNNGLGEGDDFCLRWWVGPGADQSNVSVQAQSNDDSWYSYPDIKNDGYRARRQGRTYTVTPIRFTARGEDADVIFAWYNYSARRCGYQGRFSRSPRGDPPAPPRLWDKLMRDLF